MLNSVLWNRNISHSTKLLIHKLTVKIYWHLELTHCQQNGKNKLELLGREMDYVRRSAKISRMDRIRNETIRTKLGMKKDILQETKQHL
jgi:hypothetical protein